jgi:hypothetical protein
MAAAWLMVVSLIIVNLVGDQPVQGPNSEGAVHMLRAYISKYYQAGWRYWPSDAGVGPLRQLLKCDVFHTIYTILMGLYTTWY